MPVAMTNICGNFCGKKSRMEEIMGVWMQTRIFSCVSTQPMVH